MKKIYALLAGAMIASGVSAANLEKAPRLSMENAKVVGKLDGTALKKVADKKEVLSRADESEAPALSGDYMICYTNYSKTYGNTTRMSPSNVLAPTGNEGEYKFETFIFSDVSMTGNLHYEPEFWTDESGKLVGEWVLSIPVGETSEPLFYEDLSDYSRYGFTNNEPIYFYFAGIDGSDIGYYTNDTYDFVVRDGWLISPYVDGVGFAMASRFIPNVGGITFGAAYIDLFTALPNAHGTAVEESADEYGNPVSEAIEFPMYTETYEEDGLLFWFVKGFCGWPGAVMFVLSQEDAMAYTENMPLTVIQDTELFMIQNDESTEVYLDVTPENEGNTVLSTELIGLQDTDGGLWVIYSDVNVTLDYNVWTGEGNAGVKNPTVEDVNAPTVYYNMQGMQITNPTAGQLYIVKKGDKVSKQIIK